MTRGKARPCRSCGWKPTVRPRRKGNQPRIPDWRHDRGVMALLFARRPDLVTTATPGARILAAITENV